MSALGARRDRLKSPGLTTYIYVAAVGKRIIDEGIVYLELVPTSLIDLKSYIIQWYYQILI